MNEFVLVDDTAGLAHYSYVMLIMLMPGLIGVP